VVVAEPVPELEPKRVVVGLQFLANLVQLFPCLRECLNADFGEPVGPPIHQLTDIAERHRLPFAVDDNRLASGVVPAAVLVADLLAEICDVEVLLAELDDLQ